MQHKAAEARCSQMLADARSVEVGGVERLLHQLRPGPALPHTSPEPTACLRPAFEVKSAELYGGRRSAARSASASGAVRCELCCSAARPCEEAMMQTGGCGTANETPGCREPQS